MHISCETHTSWVVYQKYMWLKNWVKTAFNTFNHIFWLLFHVIELQECVALKK